MSVLLQPQYTSRRGYYSTRELQYLSLSLGHDENLFGRVLSKLSLKRTCYSDDEISGWLDSNLLNNDLHYIFNRHSVKYNVKVFKRAIHFLKHQHLTFAELLCGRIVYELVTTTEPFELPMQIKPVLEALKLCDKIIPPLRLQHLFHSMKRTLDTPGKLALYEFYEILGFSENIALARKAMTAEVQRPRSAVTFDETETDYEQLCSFMNEQYKASLIKPDRRLVEITAKMQAIMANKSAVTQRRRSIAQDKAYRKKLGPLLASSTKKLVHARAGQHVLSAEQTNSALIRLCCRKSASL